MAVPRSTPLEFQVMGAMWTAGASSVRQILKAISRTAARRRLIDEPISTLRTT
jgi:predicted transcriptional regulator